MSVLLEALKKAAEEKKQSASNESVDAVNPRQSQLALKTSASDSPVIESPSPIKIINTDAIAQETSTEIPVIPETDLPISTHIKLSVDVPEKAEKIAVSIDDLDLTNNAPNAANEPPQIELSEPVLLNSAITGPDFVLPDEPVIETLENVMTDNLSEHEQNTAKKQSELNESYDWSMDKLPGYESKESHIKASEADESNLKPNKILTTNKRFIKSLKFLTIRQFVFGRSSNVAIYTLFSVLVLSTVGFFSVYYFQQQADELDQSMRKYNLVRTVLPTEVISTQALDVTKTPPVSLKQENQIDEFNEVVKPILNPKDSYLDEALIAEVALIQRSVPTKNPVSLPASKANVSNSIASEKQSNAYVISSSNEQSNMQQAYTALYENNLVVAEKLFSELLQGEPEDIAVLNGYASVQAQLGNRELSLETYQDVLALAPNNLHAFEALVSLLSDRLEASEWIAEIKRILKLHPESSVLNYSLGNLYAKEGDWKTAQPYYFDAHALDSQNADYMMNLAVSLDQLGQYPLAEQYYTSALVFAGSQSISFNEEEVKQRLIAIRNLIESSRS